MKQGSHDARVRFIGPNGAKQTKDKRSAQTNGCSASPWKRGKRRLPHWDSTSLTLWLGRQQLRRIARNATDQLAVVEAFQGQSKPWHPPIIDNPVKREGEGVQKRKHRLMGLCNRLNRGLPEDTIRFRTFNKGLRIGWEYAGKGPKGKAAD